MRWPDATLYEGLREVADRNPDATALHFRGERTTYAELLAESRALARGLADLGVGAGDRVAVWLGNRPEWVTTQLAVSRLGAAAVAVNTRYRTHELAYMLRDSGASVLVTEESFLGNDYLEMLAEVAPEVREDSPDEFDAGSVPLEAVVGLSTDPDFPAVRGYEAVLDRDRELAPSVDALDPTTDPEAPVTVFYTSGTTSDPKGCLQSSRSVLNHSYNVGSYLGLGSDDVALGVLPFCGVWGYNTMLSALSRGIPLVVETHFEPERTLDLIEEHGVTYCNAQAVMFDRMRRSESFDPERVATLRRGVTAFLTMGVDGEVFAELEAAFDFPLVQPYGISEGNSMVFVGDPDDPLEQRERVGGPPVHPDAEVRVVDPETGEELPAGEEGELCLRGYNVMNGYHDKPEQTAAAVDDGGWLHTGDLGVRDEAGYFYYRSRLDDALRVRGFLVTPRDIEAALNGQPGVDQAQVVGASHPRHGQVPVAFVIRADGSDGDDGDLDAATLRESLAAEVADYKVPEDIEFVEEFPRTEGPHGAKVRKGELRERVADRYQE
ncbi:class I adenylate-forming enzyme family protein [Salinirussus salinus]|uniref:class I adenylate-forming enzyme family protein n=1 Tax=Salinirussus salinus TaxID=1198300 RepID=UPI00135958D3|nr:AMP-binding protein [Salinirussus salinus]